MRDALRRFSKARAVCKRQNSDQWHQQAVFSHHGCLHQAVILRGNCGTESFESRALVSLGQVSQTWSVRPIAQGRVGGAVQLLASVLHRGQMPALPAVGQYH